MIAFCIHNLDSLEYPVPVIDSFFFCDKLLKITTKQECCTGLLEITWSIEAHVRNDNAGPSAGHLLDLARLQVNREDASTCPDEDDAEALRKANHSHIFLHQDLREAKRSWLVQGDTSPAIGQCVEFQDPARRPCRRSSGGTGLSRPQVEAGPPHAGEPQATAHCRHEDTVTLVR